MPKSTKYINTKDVVRLSGLTTDEVLNLAKTSVLPAHKTRRGHWRYNVDAVEKYFGIKINKPEEEKKPNEITLDKTQKGAIAEVKKGGSLFVTGKAGISKMSEV